MPLETPEGDAADPLRRSQEGIGSDPSGGRDLVNPRGGCNPTTGFSQPDPFLS